MQKNRNYPIFIISILAFGLFMTLVFSSRVDVSTQAKLGVSKVNQISAAPIYQSTSGKVTGVKLLNVTGLPQSEVSFIENGTILDIGSVTNAGTFLETYKSNGTMYGQGKGTIATKNGDSVSWISYDLGEINSDKSQKYRGIIFFDTASNGKFEFLNNTIGLYTTIVGSDGSSLRQIWQWK